MAEPYWQRISRSRLRDEQMRTYRRQADAVLFRHQAQLGIRSATNFMQGAQERRIAALRASLDQQQEERQTQESGGVFGRVGGGVISGLGAVADVISRPLYGVASFADASVNLVQGEADNPFTALGEGLAGRRRTTFANVLENAGVENRWARTILGFGMDVMLDPLTWVTFGAGGATKIAFRDGSRLLVNSAGRKVYQEAADTAFRSATKRGLSEATARTLSEEAGQKSLLRAVSAEGGERFLERGGIKFGPSRLPFMKAGGAIDQPGAFRSRPLTRMTVTAGGGGTPSQTLSVPRLSRSGTEMAGDFLKILPGVRQMRDGIGKMFVTFYPVREAAQRLAHRSMTGSSAMSPEDLGRIGNNMEDVVDILSDIKRGPQAMRQFSAEFLRDKMPQLAALSPEDKKRFYLIAHGVDKMPARDVDDLLKTIGLAPTDLRDPGPAVQSLIDWLRGEYRPMVDELAGRAGVTSLLDDYFRRLIPPPERYMSADKVKQVRSGRFTRTSAAKQRKLTIQEAIRAGDIAIEQPEVALAYDLMDKATRAHTNDLLNEALRRVGVNLDEVPEALGEGFVRYDPSVRVVLSADNKAVKNMGVPAEIADALSDLFHPRQVTPILRLFDWAQGTWKGLVTSIFPDFHMRNLFGDTYNSWYQGVTNPAAFIRGARLAADPRWGGWRKSVFRPYLDDEVVEGTRYTAGELRRLARDRGVIGTSFYGEDIFNAAGGFSRLKLGEQGLIKRGLIRSPFSYGHTVGQARENWSRMSHFSEKLRQGFTIDDAVRSVKRSLFDYSDLTDFEKGTMRRIVPFYTFMRNNIPMQLDTLLRQPGKPAGLVKGLTAISEGFGGELSDVERALLPSYIFEQLAITIGRDGDGNPIIMSGTGLPIEQLNLLWAGTPKRTMERLFGMNASPILQAPIEMWADRSSFTGKSISDPSYQNYYRKLDGIVTKVPGLRQWLQIEEKTLTDPRTGKKRTVHNVGNPVGLYAINAIFGRLINTERDIERFGFDIKDLPDFLDTTTGIKAFSVDLSRSVGRASVERDTAFAEYNAQLELAAQALASGELLPEEYRSFKKEVGTDLARALDRADRTISEGKEELRGKILPPDERALEQWRGRVAIRPEEYPQLALDRPVKLDENDPFFAGPGGVPDMAKLFRFRDAFEALLPPETNEFLQNSWQIRLQEMPPTMREVERQYRADQDELGDYWRLEDQLWQEFRSRFPEAAPHETWGGFLRTMELGIEGGQMAGMTTAMRNPVARIFSRRLRQERERFLRMNPEVQALLVKWGYRDLALSFEGQLLAQQGIQNIRSSFAPQPVTSLAGVGVGMANGVGAGVQG